MVNPSTSACFHTVYVAGSYWSGGWLLHIRCIRCLAHFSGALFSQFPLIGSPARTPRSVPTPDTGQKRIRFSFSVALEPAGSASGFHLYSFGPHFFRASHASIAHMRNLSSSFSTSSLSLQSASTSENCGGLKKTPYAKVGSPKWLN